MRVDESGMDTDPIAQALDAIRDLHVALDQDTRLAAIARLRSLYVEFQPALTAAQGWRRRWRRRTAATTTAGAGASGAGPVPAARSHPRIRTSPACPDLEPVC